ncbi:nitroreductase family protein [Petroclostridium sp. X23]|uniref:nitroreductase family protein n=1 Tax=Petroclostridium sp. X23 TaxID=3045146 RepID=UPI0024AE53B9|nr:nitroreductase family protein [Petroclostridium sp. X23]WHH57868.1 nitroreductase family protein [Petroclostridium sp. X23]
MKQTNLYEAIFKRKSVRKYDLNPLDENTLAEISAYTNVLKPIDSKIKTEMMIVSQEQIKNLLPIKSPHYIVVSSENKEGYLTNVGFMLQQMDLFLSINGIGSCWVGMAKPIKAVKEGLTLEFVIAMAFGKAEEPLHRNSTQEFKRKTLSEISSGSGMEEQLEAVRLAPSATNGQPWYFVVNKDTIDAFCIKPNFIRALMYERMNKIDMGIAFCHFWLASKQLGKDIEFIHHSTAQDNPPKGYDYTATIKVK